MRLDVPYRSQLDNESTAPNDCGQACVLSLLLYYGFVSGDVTVDDLSRRMPGKTTAGQLAALAGYYGMPLIADTGPTLTRLRAFVDSGHPVVVLVNYLDLQLPPHLSTPDQGWHWLLVVGYEGDTVFVHDPLWLPSQRDGQGGAYVPIAGDVLAGAFVGNSLVYHARALDEPKPAGPTKLGAHIIPGPRTGYGDFLEARPALVKAVDEPSVLEEARRVSPETMTIYRTRKHGDTPPGNFSGDPRDTAWAWMRQLEPEWAGVDADYFEPVNEPDPPDARGWQWLAAFTEECVHIAQAWGVKLALFSFASGVPEADEFDLLLPALRVGYERGAILSLHEYALRGDGTATHPDNWPSLLTRYRMYHSALYSAGLGDMRIAITEFAPCFGGHQWDACGVDRFLAGCQAYDCALRTNPYVIGAALFTLGGVAGGEWERANWSDAIPALVTWMQEGECV